MLQLGMLFFLYSTISVFSASNVIDDENANKTIVPNGTKSENLGGSSTTILPYIPSSTPASSKEIPADSNSTVKPTTNSTYKKGSYRPKRNCTPAAIDQFPPTLLPRSFREHGGLIFHILIAIFTFLGLAIVCDDYFVASLDRICEELKLSPDVAGATFMAAGSSAPELGTVIIGVFFAKDDIGVSGVIGSAVFNIMFVISVCALCSGNVCHLNWWPLVRDCFFYSLSIIVMIVIMLNDYISWVSRTGSAKENVSSKL